MHLPAESPIPFAHFLCPVTLSSAVAARWESLDVSKEEELREERRRMEILYMGKRIGDKYTTGEKGVKEITSKVAPSIHIPCLFLSALYSSDRYITQNKGYNGPHDR